MGLRVLVQFAVVAGNLPRQMAAEKSRLDIKLCHNPKRGLRFYTLPGLPLSRLARRNLIRYIPDKVPSQLRPSNGETPPERDLIHFTSVF